jgi:thiol-disulfide isomerase/thioredoxin
MNKIWKPLVLILVVGIMVADVVLDSRTKVPVFAGSVENNHAVDPAVASLPVGTQTGDRAPNIVGVTLTGEKVSLAELQGRTVLINVFASWCGPCRVEAPHLVEAFNELNPDDFVFVGLNLQEAPDAVAGFQTDFGIEFPLLLNQDGALTEIFRPIGLPTSWFIDADGVVRYVHSGPVTSELLIRAMQDVEAGRQPDPFATSG